MPRILSIVFWCGFDLGKYYVILPTEPVFNLEDFKLKFNAVPVPKGFSYNSETNTKWETVESMRLLIQEHVDETI